MDDAASGASKSVRLLASHQDLVDLLFAEVSASPWSVTRDRFESALERSAAKRFGSARAVSRPQLEEYLGALHLQDLSLAAACASGHSAAWEFFVITYRGYLRAASAAILRCSASSPAAQDLADSLFTDLYGISPAEKSEDRSLFRYFHGRSSLKTWLRAVLAQRHIDSIRASRRFIDLDEPNTDGAEPPRVTRIDSISTNPNPARDASPDPHRSRYLSLFAAALDHALNALDPQNKQRLRLYYVDQQTLAQIGRDFGEHESSVSRHLDRIRCELRAVVEATLRAGNIAQLGAAAIIAGGALNSQNGTQPQQLQPGLSDAQISLCFEYAAEDAPINFDQLFPGSTSASSPAQPTHGETERQDP